MSDSPYSQVAAAEGSIGLNADGEPNGSASPDPVLSSTQLLQGRKTVHIEHNGALYMLRTTKLGKLILTK